MLKPISGKSLLSAVLIFALGSMQPLLAAEPASKHQHHKLVERQSERVKTDNGFTRTINKTDDQGLNSTRHTDVVTNKEAGTRTKSLSGSTFADKAYSGQATAQKTAAGYSAQGQLSTSDGKVIDRSVNAQVDKTTNTLTKDVAVTPVGGETKTRSVVRPLKRNK